MKYTVIGTGAIGGYYGGKLARAGLEVNFLARSDYEHIKQKGLQIDSVYGDFHLNNVNVFSSAGEMPETDAVIISLKTTSNRELKNIISPLVKAGTAILVLQNGLGMEEEIQKDFPDAAVIGGMCFICSQKRGHGHIVHMDEGSVNFSPLNEKHSVLMKNIIDDFEKAEIKASYTENLKSARWGKLLWNIPFNGLSVVLNANTSEIMNSEYATSIARMILEEVMEGAEACGCTLHPDSPERILKFTRKMVPYDPSMKLDFDSRRELEIEYIYRNPIKEAEKHGVKLPLIKMLADQLSFINSRF